MEDGRQGKCLNLHVVLEPIGPKQLETDRRVKGIRALDIRIGYTGLF